MDNANNAYTIYLLLERESLECTDGIATPVYRYDEGSILANVATLLRCGFDVVQKDEQVVASNDQLLCIIRLNKDVLPASVELGNRFAALLSDNERTSIKSCDWRLEFRLSHSDPTQRLRELREEFDVIEAAVDPQFKSYRYDPNTSTLCGHTLLRS